jgi:hypothetical protein
VIHNIVQALGVCIKRRKWRRYNGAHFGRGYHVIQMSEVKWRFSDHKHEPAALFQGDVSGTREK